MTTIFRNYANQFIQFGSLINVSDGSRLVSSATVRVCKDGTWANGAGTLSVEETDQYKYIPTKAETNCGFLTVVVDHSTAVAPLVYSRRTRGIPVIFLNHDGDDSSSGAALLAAANSLATGWALKWGPGTWAIGDNQIAQPALTLFDGPGLDIGTITCTRQDTTSQFRPGSHSLFQDFTWRSLISNDDTGDFPIGIGPSESGAITDAYGRRLRAIGCTDCILVSTFAACSMTIEDAILESSWDTTMQGLAAHTMRYRNVDMICREHTPSKVCRGLNNLLGGTTYADGVRIILVPRASVTTDAIGININGGYGYVTNSSVHIHGVAKNNTHSIDGGAFDEESEDPQPTFVRLTDCEFDRSLVRDARLVLDEFTPISNATYGLPVIATSASAAAVSAASADGKIGTPAVTVSDDIAAIDAGGGSASGPGADQITITITDGADPIPDAGVWITSDSGGATTVAGTLTTNSDGQVTFLLDDGVGYYLSMQKDGWNSIIAQSFTASAADGNEFETTAANSDAPDNDLERTWICRRVDGRVGSTKVIPKAAGESPRMWLDVSRLLDLGESIASITSITAAGMTTGGEEIVGKLIQCYFTGGTVTGDPVDAICTFATSTGRPVECRGYLQVV